MPGVGFRWVREFGLLPWSPMWSDIGFAELARRSSPCPSVLTLLILSSLDPELSGVLVV